MDRTGAYHGRQRILTLLRAGGGGLGDGKTAIVGAPGPPDSVDNPGYQGAAYIFTQNNGSWTQQAKLIGNGTSFAQQGASVAISGDGN